MNKLDAYNYSLEEGFNRIITKLTYKTLSRYFYGVSCLEMGCADGVGTQFLIEKFKHVTAVDGSSKMIKKLRKRLVQKKNLEIVLSYFENLSLNKKFDTIMVSHVLEHVDDSIRILKVTKKHAHKKTIIIIEVPNAHSLHRQAGVLMGLIKEEHSLNSSDKSVGHKRVFDLDLLTQIIIESGLKIKKTGGFLLKPFSNTQLEKIFDSEKMIKAYSELGEKYPGIAAEIYAICSL